MRRMVVVSVVWVVVVGGLASAAAAAVTPGWECIPTTTGQAVTSGGTGADPSCASGTPVLAPTYVSSGVGGKPTVEFSAVNVQVVSGSGATSGTVNGEGNLVVGYAENPSGFAQTGSNDLIVGSGNGWRSYGSIVGGTLNQATGSYATTVGYDNVASGLASFAAGLGNTASGARASVLGGYHNVAAASESSVAGGCGGRAGTGTPATAACPTGGASTVTGGQGNQASGQAASVTGGAFNTASASASSVLGGDKNNASSSCQSIPASPGTC